MTHGKWRRHQGLPRSFRLSRVPSANTEEEGGLMTCAAAGHQEAVMLPLGQVANPS